MFGRKRNPIGKDGKVMKCHKCGSEEHFEHKCNKGAGLTMLNAPAASVQTLAGAGVWHSTTCSHAQNAATEDKFAQPSVAASGPLPDLLQGVIAEHQTATYMIETGASRQTADAPVKKASSGAAPLWQH